MRERVFTLPERLQVIIYKQRLLSLLFFGFCHSYTVRTIYNYQKKNWPKTKIKLCTLVPGHFCRRQNVICSRKLYTYIGITRGHRDSFTLSRSMGSCSAAFNSHLCPNQKQRLTATDPASISTWAVDLSERLCRALDLRIILLAGLCVFRPIKCGVVFASFGDAIRAISCGILCHRGRGRMLHVGLLCLM